MEELNEDVLALLEYIDYLEKEIYVYKTPLKELSIKEIVDELVYKAKVIRS